MAYAPTDTGQRLIDLNQIGVAISTENELFTTAAATATGTTQATAYQIGNLQTIVEFTTVAANTGCMLPLSSAGFRLYIANNGAQTLTIYTSNQETVASPKINGTSGATGVTQVAGNNACYWCATPGQWYRISGT